MIYLHKFIFICVLQHSVLFCNDSDGSEASYKRASTARTGKEKDKADAASSPESFASAKDGVINFLTYFKNFLNHSYANYIYIFLFIFLTGRRPQRV